MHRFLYTHTVEDVTLAESATVTLLQARAAATRRLELVEWGFWLDESSTGKDPVNLRLEFHDTDGTATSRTPVPLVEDGIAADFTFADTFTVEPTPGGSLKVVELRPDGGGLIMKGEDIDTPIVTAVGGRIALRVATEASGDANATFYMVVAEV